MTSFIDAINQTAGVNTVASTTPEKSDDIMGKEDFLSLLVAQLQNQDPLNPDEPTEFTAQLAQFSSLEQLYNINDGMNSLIQSNTNSDRLSTLSTIGKNVAYFGDDFTYKGEPVELGYQLDGIASEVTLSLQQNGVVYATIDATELSSGNHFITWDGLTSDGTEAPIGDYQIVLSAKAHSGESVGAAPIIRTEVTGVDLNDENGGILITNNGEINFNEILGVYEAGAVVSDNTTEEDETSVLQSTEDTVNTAEEAINTTNDVATLIDGM